MLNMWHYILMLAGFVLVIKGAGLFVDGAGAIAKRLKVSDLVVGLTVVAFGTSLPELFVNIIASIEGNAAIAIGNIVGSNIANILLILGVSGIIFPLTVTKGTVWKEIPLSLLAAVLLGVLINDRLIDGQETSVLSRIDGLVLLSFFIIFLFYSYSIAQRIEGQYQPRLEYKGLKICTLLVIGLVGLIAGGKLVVDGAVRLADDLGVSESVIGLTIVAVGTSIPELATSAVAAYKRNPEIAVGNVVGSNIFNIFFILGISSEIRPMPIPASSNRDIAVLISASALLMVFMYTGKRRVLDRWEAVLFLAAYAGYICFLVMV
jgi:cation:H+ antiporter